MIDFAYLILYFFITAKPDVTNTGASWNAGPILTTPVPNPINPRQGQSTNIGLAQSAVVGGETTQRGAPSSQAPVVSGLSAQFGAGGFSGQSYPLQNHQATVGNGSGHSQTSGIVSRNSDQGFTPGTAAANKALKMSMHFVPPGAEFDNRPLYVLESFEFDVDCF